MGLIVPPLCGPPLPRGGPPAGGPPPPWPGGILVVGLLDLAPASGWAIFWIESEDTFRFNCVGPLLDPGEGPPRLFGDILGDGSPLSGDDGGPALPGIGLLGPLRELSPFGESGGFDCTGGVFVIELVDWETGSLPSGGFCIGTFGDETLVAELFKFLGFGPGDGKFGVIWGGFWTPSGRFGIDDVDADKGLFAPVGFWREGGGFGLSNFGGSFCSIGVGILGAGFGELTRGGFGGGPPVNSIFKLFAVGLPLKLKY